MHCRRGFICLFTCLVLSEASPVSARLIRVPVDYATIAKAVALSQAGDIVEVDDGFYFEANIVIDRPIILRSKNPFGAVLAGQGDLHSAAFTVRAETEISGFIIKNYYDGIIQRDSPDVGWKARNIAILDCEIGISVNDRLKRVGSAILENIIIDRCNQAISANDARSIDAGGLFISRSLHAIGASNFTRFFVDRLILWECSIGIMEDRFLLPHFSDKTKIEAGENVFRFDRRESPSRLDEMEQRIIEIFAGSAGDDEGQKAAGARKALLMTVLGESYLDAESWNRAENFFRKAAAAVRPANMEEVQWRMEWGLGRADEGRGNTAGAIAHYKESIDHIDRIGLGLPISTILANFRGDKIDVYETLLSLLATADRQAPEKNFDEEAFQAAEQSKARSLLSNLPAVRYAMTGRLAEKEDELLAFRLTRCQLALQNPNISPEERTALLEKLNRIETDRNEYFLRAGTSSSPSSSGNPFRFESLKTIRREILGPSEALIEYVVGKKASFAFLLTREGLNIAPLPPEAELNTLITTYLKFLTVIDSPVFYGWEGGHRLWRILIEPFRERLGENINSLIIVPDGSLHHLPFEALVCNPAEKRYAIEEFEIRYAPSASFLVHLKAGAVRPKARMDFLGLANPFSISMFGLTTGERRVFPPLPGARREIKAASGRFPRERTTLLAGSRGLEAGFKEAALEEYRIIHFAVHGWIDDRNWMRSSLLLGADEAGNQDGFLQPAEIKNLRLSAELIVLSGCDTGTGRLERGEGIRGFSAAFLMAGARSLILSQWALEDRAAADFMDVFYGKFAGGKSKAAALREAKLALLNSSRRHPVYWAPFKLFGG